MGLTPSTDRTRYTVLLLALVRMLFHYAMCVVAVVQGVIRYELVGIFPAQSFFEINAVSGDVVLRNSLLSDSEGREIYTVSTGHVHRTAFK